MRPREKIDVLWILMICVSLCQTVAGVNNCGRSIPRPDFVDSINTVGGDNDAVIHMIQHGNNSMGVHPDCDDGETDLDVDWDEDMQEYTCQMNEVAPGGSLSLDWTKQVNDTCYQPVHYCMHEKIIYEKPFPTSGGHRPVWPMFGEFTYLPPQRWIHALEHGAIVFLYHPCADQTIVEQYRTLVETTFTAIDRCKYIITPYRVPCTFNTAEYGDPLPTEYPPYTFLYWCRRLHVNEYNEDLVMNFIQNNALSDDAPEFDVKWDGDYEFKHIGDSGCNDFYNSKLT